uniref:Rz1-like lysis system protein LysC n=1 Tax=Cellvibrio fontiphilus TaxID=1815559 RepID=UPI003898E940
MCGCTSAPASNPPPIIWNTCDSPTPCTLRAMNPKSNGEFQEALEQASADWAECAAKVDQHIHCNQRAFTSHHEKTE